MKNGNECVNLNLYEQEFQKSFSEKEVRTEKPINIITADKEGNIIYCSNDNIGIISKNEKISTQSINDVKTLIVWNDLILIVGNPGIFAYSIKGNVCKQLKNSKNIKSVQKIERIDDNRFLIISENKLLIIKIKTEKGNFKIDNVETLPSIPDKEAKLQCMKCNLKVGNGKWEMGKIPLNPPLLKGEGRGLYVGTNRGLWKFDGKNYKQLIPLSGLGYRLGHNVRSLDFDTAGNLWVGTNSDVMIYANDEKFYRIGWTEGLPYQDVRVVKCKKNGEIWVGTVRGAARFENGKWHYYGGKRWLPDDTINDIYIHNPPVFPLHKGGQGEVWFATNKGISEIWTEKISLEYKSDLFIDRVKKRHYRMGYVASSYLPVQGNLSKWIQEASDNDGCWTGVFVASEALRYEVTKDKEAKKNAQQSFRALKKLVDITPIDGFVARALIKKGENVIKSGGEWHDTPDGKWEWKGDTSTDEIDGHYFAYAVYYDTVAETEKEKDEVREVVRAIADHLIRNNFNLIDLDGKHTTWGTLGPDLLSTEEFKAQRGLNSLEILSHLKVTYHVTGDDKYQKEYLKLIKNYGYALNTIEQKLIKEGEFVHHDNELAFLAYYPLFLYEEDLALRRIYLMSLERTWKYIRAQHNPLWNFIYSFATGKICDINEAVEWMRNVPMDMRCWSCYNSHRSDLKIKRGNSRGNGIESEEALPIDERAVTKLDGNPYQLDGGSDGWHEDDGAFFLLCYWAGRYLEYIRE